jgi:predicted ATP-grasp superfamily ATP-dependent carboligase
LYPVAEITVYTLLAHKEKLNTVVLPFPDLKTVRRVSDKGSLVKLCCELGLRVPASDYYERGQQLAHSGVNYKYPIVLKPTLSRILTEEGWLDTSVKYANSAEEMYELIQNLPYFSECPFMVQEYIDGYGSGIFLLFNEGEYVAHFAHKRIREKPPSGGVSVLSESIEADSEQFTIAQSILTEVQWHGVAMVEFKVDKSGHPYVIEVNPRFWGSLQLAIDSNVDFPFMLHELSMNRDAKNVTQYKIGQKLRWILGDFDSLYLFLKDPKNSFPLKLAAILKFLAPWQPRMRYEVNRLSDLRPFWFEVRKYIKSFLT